MAVSLKRLKDAIIESNGIVYYASKLCGISRSQMHRYIKKYEVLQELLEFARLDNVDRAQNKLIAHMNKEVLDGVSLGATKFFLMTQGKHLGYTLKDTNELDKEKYNINITYEIVKNEKDKNNT